MHEVSDPRTRAAGSSAAIGSTIIRGHLLLSLTNLAMVSRVLMAIHTSKIAALKDTQDS
jgi:hypothetical protein